MQKFPTDNIVKHILYHNKKWHVIYFLISINAFKMRNLQKRHLCKNAFHVKVFISFRRKMLLGRKLIKQSS